jgi:formylglycine-generating enzyme required for sulfatase activity
MKNIKYQLIFTFILSLFVVSFAADITYIGSNSKGYSEYQNKKDGLVLVEIPEGEFLMGSTPKEGVEIERPQHKVYVDRFYISKFEVTNEQFEKFIQATKYKTEAEKSGKPNWRSLYTKETAKHPVARISWNDANAYCEWADLRLPTEAEWEKAARGIDKRKYPWGKEEPGAKGIVRANYADNNTNYKWSDYSTNDGYKNTSPVGSFPAGISYFGCFDMAGNVWEFCSDRLSEFYYMITPLKNPQGPDKGNFYVMRGGSWFGGTFDLRCATRGKVASSYFNNDLGFRPAAYPPK